MLRVLAHGGAGSFDSKQHDGPETAAKIGLAVLKKGGTVLDAVLAATVSLEDDPRFNAGTGSNLRMDGKTIEMDAAVMDDRGRFGGVACLTRVKNPVLVAKAVLETPHNLLAGAGATAFARKLGFEDHDPRTPDAVARFKRLQAMFAAGKFEQGWSEWDVAELSANWNYETPLREVIGPTDTVGAVATDGTQFAVALSTGGTTATLLGRVGDVPLPGCGLVAGKHGAVCVTGDGDHLARAMLADRVYQRMKAGESPDAIVAWACHAFGPDVAVGLILVTPNGYAAGSNLQMAWAVAE